MVGECAIGQTNPRCDGRLQSLKLVEVDVTAFRPAVSDLPPQRDELVDVCLGVGGPEDLDVGNIEEVIKEILELFVLRSVQGANTALYKLPEHDLPLGRREVRSGPCVAASVSEVPDPLAGLSRQLCVVRELACKEISAFHRYGFHIPLPRRTKKQKATSSEVA